MANSRPQRCASPPCAHKFVPRRGGSSQRYCSVGCRRRARDGRYRATERGRQVQLDADRRYARSAKGRERDARWYAAGGWYLQERSKRQRRLVENVGKLEAIGFNTAAFSPDALALPVPNRQTKAELVFGGLRAARR